MSFYRTHVVMNPGNIECNHCGDKMAKMMRYYAPKYEATSIKPDPNRPLHICFSCIEQLARDADAK